MIETANEILTFDGPHYFLSNFYPQPIIFDGRRWATSEHAYQAAKAIIVEQREEIAAASTPGVAKRLGKKAVLREDWEAVKAPIMRAILEAKFSIPKLREMLLSTGNLRLIEGNTWGDTFWGVDIRSRVGQNMLGKLLMGIREEIRSFE